MTVEDVLARLDGVTGGDGQWYSKCPSHDDRQASLSIARGRDDRVLLHCWAGCDVEDVVAALGLTMRDLFARSASASTLPRPVRVGWLRGGRS